MLEIEFVVFSLATLDEIVLLTYFLGETSAKWDVLGLFHNDEKFQHGRNKLMVNRYNAGFHEMVNRVDYVENWLSLSEVI